MNSIVRHNRLRNRILIYKMKFTLEPLFSVSALVGLVYFFESNKVINHGQSALKIKSLLPFGFKTLQVTLISSLHKK